MIAIQPLTPLERLAYYNPKNNQFIQLNASNVKNLHVQGKDVYVLVHGWSPGYSDWVQDYAQKYHKVLEWWDTFPTQRNYHGELDDKNLGPMSAWLLDGYPSMPGDDTAVSANGLAKDLIDSDPHPKNALVLAYSWLDDSATPDGPTIIPGLPPIPEDGNIAGAKTTLNGERLAGARAGAGVREPIQGQASIDRPQFRLEGGDRGGGRTARCPLTDQGQPAHDSRLPRIRLLWWQLPVGIRAHKQQLVLPASPDDQTESRIEFERDVCRQLYFGIRRAIRRHFLYEVQCAVQYGPESGCRHGSLSRAQCQRAQLRRRVVRRVIGRARYDKGIQGRQVVVAAHGQWENHSAQNYNGITSYNQQSKFWDSSDQYYLDTPYFPAVLSNTPTFTTVDLSPASPDTPAGVSVTNHPDVNPGDGTGATVKLMQKKSDDVAYTGSFIASGRYLSGVSFNYQFKNWTKGDKLNIYVVTVNADGKEIDESLRFTMSPWLSPSPARYGHQATR